MLKVYLVASQCSQSFKLIASFESVKTETLFTHDNKA